MKGAKSRFPYFAEVLGISRQAVDKRRASKQLRGFLAFKGSKGWVRSSAWMPVFSSTHNLGQGAGEASAHYRSHQGISGRKPSQTTQAPPE
jgi:hypothetical protein